MQCLHSQSGLASTLSTLQYYDIKHMYHNCHLYYTSTSYVVAGSMAPDALASLSDDDDDDLEFIYLRKIFFFVVVVVIVLLVVVDVATLLLLIAEAVLRPDTMILPLVFFLLPSQLARLRLQASNKYYDPPLAMY